MAFVVKYEERREKQKKSYSPSVRALSLSSKGTPSEDFTGGYSRALPPVLKRPSPPAPPQPSVGAARSFVRVSSFSLLLSSLSFSVLFPSQFFLLLSYVSFSVLSPLSAPRFSLLTLWMRLRVPTEGCGGAARRPLLRRASSSALRHAAVDEADKPLTTARRLRPCLRRASDGSPARACGAAGSSSLARQGPPVFGRVSPSTVVLR